MEDGHLIFHPVIVGYLTPVPGRVTLKEFRRNLAGASKGGQCPRRCQHLAEPPGECSFSRPGILDAVREAKSDSDVLCPPRSPI
jgi:hypothetical protein